MTMGPCSTVSKDHLFRAAVPSGASTGIYEATGTLAGCEDDMTGHGNVWDMVETKQTLKTDEWQLQHEGCFLFCHIARYWIAVLRESVWFQKRFTSTTPKNVLEY